MYIARTRTYDDGKQSIKEHSEETARLASEFAIEPLKDVAYQCGILHDCGKYTADFQRKIKGEGHLKVAHALCGAKALNELGNGDFITKMMQFCIAGHHAGLQDFGNKADDEEQTTLCGTLKRSTQDYSGFWDELLLRDIDRKKILTFMQEDCKSPQEMVEKYAFITRYIFSCLTDADSLDSEYFETQKARVSLQSDFKKCLGILDESLASFVAETTLQKTRAILQKQVFDKVGEKADIYLMNMPTGSGKTLCSLKFAMERAVREGKKRIIYVIPYNAIIDQMASTVETMFGDAISLLRHQSTFDFEHIDDEEERMQYKLATENWDGDFIITTAVQFFESVYGNKRGKLRKLHNMADGMIIFDEAHLMPIDYLKPCLHAIAHIVKNLHSEAVFLTATMPNYRDLFDGYVNVTFLDLVTDRSDFDKFETCAYHYLELTDEDALIEHTLDKKSKLVICNSKKMARELFYKCTGEKYHLSTYMTVLDREKTIATIRQRLAENAEITVVSTSLIEAGVDLDFATVYRELAGLDSILQAGGRCNREGKLEQGEVYIFKFPETKVGDVKTSMTTKILKDFPNILGGIDDYYSRLFSENKEIISKNLLKIDGLPVYAIPFRSYSSAFNIIAKESVSIVAPTDEYSKKIVEQMRFSGLPQTKKLQKYLCNIHSNQVEELRGVIEECAGMLCLVNPEYYDDEVGLTFEGKDYFI